jgi:hypothetical protein
LRLAALSESRCSLHTPYVQKLLYSVRIRRGILRHCRFFFNGRTFFSCYCIFIYICSQICASVRSLSVSTTLFMVSIIKQVAELRFWGDARTTSIPPNKVGFLSPLQILRDDTLT